MALILFVDYSSLSRLESHSATISSPAKLVFKL